MSPKLRISAPNHSERMVDLAELKLPAVIGRDSELAQIVVPDSQSSRAHCVIGRDPVGKHLTIEDLGSRNGTWVNGQRIGKGGLRDGDVIRIGSTEVRIELSPSNRDPLLGSKIGGFELQTVIGKGRFGTVYRGVQLALSRPVAIKVLGEESRGDPERVKAFLTEARHAGRLNHPNLVQVHDVVEVDQHHLLVMELMQCNTTELLRRSGPLSEAQVLGIIDDIAKALGYAESQRLVHRDVKPDNILVNAEGVYKLADLGIAAPISDDGQAHQGRIFGSPHYIAPEQARGGAIDGRADLYALGASAWHLLTNQLMYQGTSRQIVQQHINADVPDLEAIAPNLSEGMIELVYDLLEKNPDDRPANAQDVVKRVEAIVRKASEPKPQKRRVRIRRRRRR